MIQYILECIAFQLVFLIIYDVFLKRETFFQWNRTYLIGTYVLSLVLPWIKVEAFKTAVPETFQEYPEFLWGLNDAAISIVESEESKFYISWEYTLLFGGMLLAALFFIYKLYQIYALKYKGKVLYYQDFTQVIIANSNMAFSFFKFIFLGDKIIEKEHQNIVNHELVHIKQKHSYDLIFFELMRIVGWFNPLVYVYQSRVSELHEFIADAQVAKTDKERQYELLLSEVFQTHNISFINQFFKTSLIKKRIVMLQKTKSKQVLKWRYVLLLPIILGMLFYTSCQFDETVSENDNQTIIVSDINQLTLEEEIEITTILKGLSKGNENWELYVKDEQIEVKFINTTDDSYISGLNGEKISAKMIINSIGDNTIADIFGNNNVYDGVPFGKVDEVPIFPGCEDDVDPRICFNKMMQKHIRKNFRYPDEAEKLGIQGRVSVMFVIAKDGSIQGLKMRGPDKLLEDEVERIISRLPKMQPGKADGKAVNVPFSIPISFKLEQGGFNNFYDKKGLEESEALAKKIFDGTYDGAIPFSKVDKAPIFPDCENKEDKKACFQKMIQEHIRKHFNYPEEAQEKRIQGRVAVMFIIAKDGSINGLRMRGPDKLLEDEAERIILRLPQMIPAVHNGESVDVAFSIPITFKLKNNIH